MHGVTAAALIAVVWNYLREQLAEPSPGTEPDTPTTGVAPS
ncbi:hypothetical protein ACFRJ1_09010 [Streptomyces sp. NPDC056773]